MTSPAEASRDGKVSGAAGTRPAERDPRRWRALVLLCVTGFMVILDAQIVLVALPSI